MAVAKKYIFTKKDAKAISNLGYTFTGINEISFIAFMKKYFPGFNLAHLLKQIEILTGPYINTAITRKIIVQSDKLQVIFNNDQKGNEDKALIFDRLFFRENKKLIISHEYLVLPIAARNQGLSKKILKTSLDQYIQMDADEIRVTAGLSAGAYVWARNGFTALYKYEMEAILQRTKKSLRDDEFEVVKLIYDHYYSSNPNGNDFPIRQWAALPFMKALLMGGKIQWDGRIDLKNIIQLRKFESYVTT